jgi:hypothetical protein
MFVQTTRFSTSSGNVARTGEPLSVAMPLTETLALLCMLKNAQQACSTSDGGYMWLRGTQIKAWQA